MANINYDINYIKNKISELYNKKEDIHVTINLKRKRVSNAKSKITGVYKNFFTVKSQVSLYYEDFSINYVDILIKNVSIKELDSNSD